MRLLFIAAEPREFAGVPETTPTEIAGIDWCRTARIREYDALLAANGAGAKRAAAATSVAARGFQPDAIISTGFCGALDPSIPIGGIVIATTVRNGARTYPASVPSLAREHHVGPVTTIDYVARTAGEKRKLRDSGAIAVEMEAAGVAEAAKVLGSRFYCIRAVSDLANEDMANDFNKALRNDGHFDTIRILTGALRHPIVRVPELLCLRRRAIQAARSLGDFFFDCRF